MKNTGVTISLIVFMALSLILGVTTYIGAKGTSEKKMQVASAKKATSEAQSLNSSMKNDLKQIQDKLGYEAVEDPTQLIEAIETDVTEALGAVEDNASYRTVVTRLSDNLQRKTEELKSYQAQQAVAENLATIHSEMTASQLNVFSSMESEIGDEHSANLANTNDSQKKLQDSFNEQNAELNDLKARTAQEIQVAAGNRRL